MRIKNGFVLRELGNEFILCPEGADLMDFNNMFSLNETAAFVWHHMEDTEFSAKDLEDALLDEYDLSEEQAATDIAEMLELFLKLGVIED